MQSKTGVVKRLLVNRGFGFIGRVNDNDIFSTSQHALARRFRTKGIESRSTSSQTPGHSPLTFGWCRMTSVECPIAFDPRQRFGKDEQFASDLVWKDRSLGLSPGEKSAYWKLCCFGQKSGEVFIRDETVAAEIGIHARHFRSHKTRLKELGFIDWSRAEHKRCSKYVFLLHPILTGNQCASQLTGNTSAAGTQSATGKQPAHATGNRSAGVTGNQCAVVKKQSEAIAKECVPERALASAFPELPILDPDAFWQSL
jgi:hypothetical protein